MMLKNITVTLSDGTIKSHTDVTLVDLRSDTFLLIKHKNEKGKKGATIYSTEIAPVESIPYVTEMNIKMA